MSVVEAEGLTKRFGDFEALHGISFTVNRGTITAVVGPNGAGKSTLLKIISGLINRTYGHISVLGEDPWKSASLPRRLSIILDRPFLPTLITVEDVVREAASEFHVNLKDVVNLMDELNLSPFFKNKVKDLSTGTKQKLQIVFSLLKNPELIVADEPTANLDVASRFEVYNIFVRLKEKMRVTVLISSHIASEVISISTHVMGINNGIVKYSGEVSRLIRKDMLEEFYIVVDNVEVAMEALKGYTTEVTGNQIKVRGNVVDVVSRINASGARIFYLRNSLLDKSVQGELGWE
jgi:ABC-2 type transport system ATP-binding protein